MSVSAPSQFIGVYYLVFLILLGLGYLKSQKVNIKTDNKRSVVLLAASHPSGSSHTVWLLLYDLLNKTSLLNLSLSFDHSLTVFVIFVVSIEMYKSPFSLCLCFTVSDSCFRNLAEDRSGVNLKDLVHDPSLWVKHTHTHTHCIFMFCVYFS